ncbi:MAG: hypothetical protein RSB59_00840 [Clostridia bacterium]
MIALKFQSVLMASRAYGLLAHDLQYGLSHAYMISSPDDDIVAEFFTLIATSVFCKTQNACQNCSGCLTVLHDNNPDVFAFNSQREKIKVGDMKDFFSSVSIKPMSNHKLYFVERADLMNIDAQNKLLKTLEEPPKGVTIFLGVANENGVLDTIKSRCRMVHIDTFSSADICEALVAIGCERSVAEVAADCCEGQLGKAQKIANSPEYASLYQTATDLLANLKKSGDILNFDSKKEIKDNPEKFFDVLTIIIRDILVAKSNKELILSKHIADTITELANNYSVQALSQMILQVNVARKKLTTNINVTATLDSLFFSILEVKFKWQ